MNGLAPAGFWIRAIAALVDFVLLALVQVSFRVVARLITGVEPRETWILMPVISMFMLVFAAAYTTALHAAWGQTIGKMIVGVRVLEADGEPPRIGTALLRFVGYFASIVTFFFGFFMAGLRSDKRALHDLIAGTHVERLPARARATTTPGPTAESLPPA